MENFSKLQVNPQPRSQGLSLAPGGGKKRDPGNEVGHVNPVKSWKENLEIYI